MMSLEERIGIWENLLSHGGDVEAKIVLAAVAKLRGTENDALLISFMLWAYIHSRHRRYFFRELAEKLEDSRWDKWRRVMAPLEASA